MPIDFGVDGFTPATFDVPSDFDVGLETLDWHVDFPDFDTGDLWQNNFSEVDRFFPGGEMATNGLANDVVGGAGSGNWWDFAQENISQGVNDFSASAMKGLQTSLVQTAQGLPQAAGSFFQGWLNQGTQALMRTATGQQIERAAIQGKINEVLSNPWTLFFGAIGLVFLMVMLIKR